MSRLSDLEDLRLQLLEWVVKAPIDRKAALVAQLRATLADIEDLSPKEAAGDGIDEIAERRAARRGGSSAGPGHSKRSS